MFLIPFTLMAQDSVVQNGYQIFKYPGGKKSSEGIMRNGQPDGYWKTYYENGKIKTEGNRLNFQLDSIWKFYDENGKLTLTISYKNGVYNGNRYSKLKDKIIVDHFDNGVKNGICKELYEDSILAKTIPFVDGLEDGIAKDYARDGRIVGMTKYRNGFVINQEFFNRFDQEGKKHGNWKEFYSNEELKLEGTYRNGLKNGYFKYYDEKGNLTSIEKYVDDILQRDPPELAQLEVRIDYYPDGKIKTVGSYKDSLAEGIRREYNQDGSISMAYQMHLGIIIGKGIIDEAGRRQGLWQDFYPEGNLLAIGNYVNGVKVGEWKYYHQNDTLEQIGSYDKNGYSTGKWFWYFDNGKIRRIENFFEGVYEGEMIEYDSKGFVIHQGKYVDGVQEGFWISTMNDYREEGEYLNGVKEGDWTFIFPGGQKYFEGRFIDDFPDGKHTWYNHNGTVSIVGIYVMGLKDGIWKFYDEEGKLSLTVTYKDGFEREYNSVKIVPELSIDGK